MTELRDMLQRAVGTPPPLRDVADVLGAARRSSRRRTGRIAVAMAFTVVAVVGLGVAVAGVRPPARPEVAVAPTTAPPSTLADLPVARSDDGQSQRMILALAAAV